MSSMPDTDDDDWNYLSGVLEGANNDEDLLEDPESSSDIKTPKTHLEAEIQHIAAPDAALTQISRLRPGKIHIHGQFSQASGRYLRQGLHLTDALFTDPTGSVRVVWFNQPYKAAAIKRDVDYELRGNFNLYRGRFQVSNAKIRILSQGCRPFERGEKG